MIKEGFVTCTGEFDDGTGFVLKGKVKSVTISDKKEETQFDFDYYSKNYYPKANKYCLEFEADNNDIQYTITTKDKQVTRYTAEVRVDNLTTAALEAARAGADAPRNSRLVVTPIELLSPLEKSFSEDYPALVTFIWEA